jgi:hypothetical protein
VFGWENNGIPKWCKDERGTPLSVKTVVAAELTILFKGAIVKGMSRICTLKADLSALAGALQPQEGKKRIFKRNGKPFYRVDYYVCVYFGGTQLRANLQWKDNVSPFASPLTSLLTKSQGVFREGPVEVMPNLS